MKNLKRIYDEVGEEGIEKILTAFYQKMAQDILVGFFFDGKDLAHIVQMQKAFLLRSMGVAKSYPGKTPARAHTKLPPILKGHFDRRLLLLKETLEKSDLSAESIKAWVKFEESFRKSIIRSPK